jgi:3-oxoacyl-[acyl-carrier protein] reductase
MHEAVARHQADKDRHMGEREKMRIDLSGKVALITGAGSGLGQVLAQGLANAGATVALTDLDGTLAQATASAITGPGSATGYALDVGQDDRIQAVVDEVAAAHGGIDILVNNAGLARGRWNDCSDLGMDEWLQILRINVAAPARLARACRPYMQARGGGVIVNQSSMGAYAALSSAYSISKLAISGLTVALAEEFGGDNIRVNGIAPGMMTGRLPPTLVEAMIAKQSIGRRGSADDLVGALLYLCSPLSSFVTGQTLIVDGGVTRRP